MKKILALCFTVVLCFSLSVSVFAADPMWQVSGNAIGVRCFGDSQFHTENTYSHASENASDFYCENKEEGGIQFKHITPAGLADRPQKQINVEIPISTGEKFIVNGQVINDSEEFHLSIAAGTCIKMVVRTNFSQLPIFKYNTRTVEFNGEAAYAATGDWEEIYFVFPGDTEAQTIDDFSFFAFAGTNKEDYPAGTYIDIASIAAFKNYDEAVSVNIAPGLIQGNPDQTVSEAPSAPNVPTADKTADLFGILVMTAVLSGSAAVILGKKKR